MNISNKVTMLNGKEFYLCSLNGILGIHEKNSESKGLPLSIRTNQKALLSTQSEEILKLYKGWRVAYIVFVQLHAA
jgi:hypothetical protein